MSNVVQCEECGATLRYNSKSRARILRDMHMRERHGMISFRDAEGHIVYKLPPPKSAAAHFNRPYTDVHGLLAQIAGR